MSDWKDKSFFTDDDMKNFFGMIHNEEGSLSEENTDDEQPKIKINHVQFEEFQELDVKDEMRKGISFDLLYDLPIEVSVRLGHVVMPIGEIIELKEGSIISLEKLAGERAEILVGDELLARGDVVITIDKYSVVIKEVIQPRDKIESTLYNNLKRMK